ncbi:uncharacterized protein CcaverHIS019_0208000 [Cutaneotrichosporon cavernicola]|uniref:Major facilitator superfamily (MFS) profile domain-containing protein n=1 Tax=Cutaneotrichosporon cavernicola TaxID=279322 RepID=A0AA48L2L6_9TREE|nr:uncharacterized protein CcaverHIS019_0208000 [Cutaneotrichosporon cavernicola]BEI89438.1 hypothetical protein CcaverHIS019_0208000 [Cutaneotrichosporon cavernicola]BEJ04986.1 hypothetical protein CcaverHIS641_0208030 [Cutaneotrichosporon cavernicola]
MTASERTPLLSSAGSSTLASPTRETTKFGSVVLPAVPNAKTVLPAAPAKITGDGTPAPPLHRSRPLKETMTRTRLVVILAGIWSSNFAYALQSTAIPTLAPTIASSFQHAELAAYLGSVFTLANTAFIPVYGVLIDALGRRFAMLAACSFYGAGSAACAMAPGMWSLVAARGLTGLGGGGLLTVSAVICTDLVALHERGFYQVFGVGAALGGPTAGILADRYGWPLAFWSQLPVVVFCATIVFVFLPEPPIAPTHTSLLHGLISLDWAGVVLLSTSTASLILGLSFHTSYLRPWSHPSVYGLLIASVVLLVAFVAAEMRAERPIVPMGLFKTSQLRAIWSSAVLLMIGSQALLFHVPTYFAVLMDMPAAEAGWVLSVCSGIGLSTGTLFAGHHIRRGGRYTWLGVVSLLPSIWGAWIAATWQPNWPTWGYYATILPLNTGYAVYLCVSLIALISSVDSRAMPKATALLYTVRSLGATLGVSLGGSIQVGALVRALRQRFGDMAGGEAIIDAVVHSKAAIKDLPKRYAKMALDAYAVSLRTVWIASGCVAVIAVVCASFIQQNEIHKGDEPREPREQAEQAESA